MAFYTQMGAVKQHSSRKIHFRGVIFSEISVCPNDCEAEEDNKYIVVGNATNHFVVRDLAAILSP